MTWTRPLLLEVAAREPRRLVELVLHLPEEKGALQKEVENLREPLRQRNQELSQQLEKLEQARRAAFRQAAPFRREETERVEQPQRPGGKAGHPGSYRPRPQHVDPTSEVPLCGCPDCGGRHLLAMQLVGQFMEDLPPIRPVVTQLKTYVAFRPACQKEVRSTHPWQMSIATGAAGTHLGPNALATLAELKSKGLSARKVGALSQTLFSLKLTPGGLSRALRRAGQKGQPACQGLKEEVRNAAVVHADETSWWLENRPAWLWVFATAITTLYLIDEGRGREVALEILGVEFAGVLVSDCLAIYDDLNPLQQKCYSHHLKAIKQACAVHPRQGAGYLASVQAMLQGAMALKKAQPDMAEQDFALRRQGLNIAATALLAEPRAQPAEQRVRNRLCKQSDHLFTFLDYKEVDATNNRAERPLRPAVISRKISCGNKTAAGAQTGQILKQPGGHLCATRPVLLELPSEGPSLVPKAHREPERMSLPEGVFPGNSRLPAKHIRTLGMWMYSL